MIMISWWSRLIESMRIPSIKRKLPCFKHSMRTWWIRKDLRLESDSLISFMYEWEWSSLFYRWFLSIIWMAFISERGTVIRLMYVVGCDGFIGNRRICNQKVLILIFRPILQLVSSLVVMYPSRIEIPKDCRFITVARGWTRWALLRRIPMETKAFLQHIFFFLFFIIVFPSFWTSRDGAPIEITCLLASCLKWIVEAIQVFFLLFPPLWLGSSLWLHFPTRLEWSCDWSFSNVFFLVGSSSVPFLPCLLYPYSWRRGSCLHLFLYSFELCF